MPPRLVELTMRRKLAEQLLDSSWDSDFFHGHGLMDDNTSITCGVCAVFLLYKLVTSATPDTCSERALNTPKALHKHASTPGSHFVHVSDIPKTRQKYVDGLCANAPNLGLQ